MGNTFKLKNGSILLSTEAPGGIYNASQLKKIAALCDGDAVVVKATEDQRLALLVNPSMAASIAEELKSIGLGIRHYQDGLHQPVSCVGEMCEDHEQDALGSALDISAEIEGLQLNSALKIGINGCAKCCVPCHTLDISIVGDSSGYKISLGGKNSQIPEMASFMAEGIPAAEMPKLVRAIIDIYKDGAQEGDTLQAFIDRDGAGKFIQALAPWSQDAADSSDPFAPPSPVDALGASEENAVPEPILEKTADAEELTGVPDGDAIEPADWVAGEDPNLDLAMDATPLDNEALNQEHIFAIEAEKDSDLSLEIGEIPVEASGAQNGVDVPMEAPLEDDGPMVSVHENGLEGFGGLVEAELLSFDPENEPDLESKAPIPPVDGDHLDRSDVNDTAQSSDAEQNEAKSDTAPVVSADLSEENAGSDPTDEVLLDENSEDAMEAALSASIAAQKDLSEDNTSDAVRDEGVSLLESSSASLVDDETKGSLTQTVESSEDPLTIDQGDHDEDADGEDFDVHDHLPLSEVVATKKITPEKVSRTLSVPKKSWAIAGFDLDDLGAPIISWTNGATMTITSEAIAHGVLRVGGHSIFVAQKDGGLQVEVDGVRMFLPVAA